MLSSDSYGDLLLLLLQVAMVAGPAVYLWKYVVVDMWWRPRRSRRIFEAQGIKCLPQGSFLRGNLPEFVALNRNARALPMSSISHDIIPRMLPHWFHWSKACGDPFFVHWFGSQPRIILTEPSQAKEVLSQKFGFFAKVSLRPDANDLIGKGLSRCEGEKWVQCRRIMNPAFYIEKLKAMTPIMVDCTLKMMSHWDALVEKGEEIEVHEQFRAVTGDIIAHTAFGSSFAEGKQVFLLQREQQFIMDKLFREIYIPGLRFIPTQLNRYRWKINKEIIKIIGGIIRNRMKCESYGNDLLGLMMAANKGELKGNQRNLTMSIDEIIDQCKNIFFAGHDTTATVLSWTLLLLATNPEWQERTREEVDRVCGRVEPPTAESLTQLKLVGMVLNEALRLYPPGPVVQRQTVGDTQLGKFVIPGGTVLLMPVIAWQHDPKYWGPDANEFNPERFNGGLTGEIPGIMYGAYMPFSTGPRTCIGNNFAMLEAKVVLCLILQRYQFRVSPSYRHGATTVITLQPEYGVPLILEKL